VAQPGKLDAKLNEFWVGNPWQIVSEGHNLSSFERNRLYLNLNGNDFIDVSMISHTDSDGDGRCAVAADFRNTGMPDLLVRQVGGGALQYFVNQLPKANSLRVSLRGTKSNRQGIGARVIAMVGGQRITREVYPACSYRSQKPAEAHFGLATHNAVESLEIRWPSGEVQIITHVRANQHIVVEEGTTTAPMVVTPGTTIRP
jgi:hypothetical protein